VAEEPRNSREVGIWTVVLIRDSASKSRKRKAEPDPRLADSVTGIHAKRSTSQVPSAPIAHIMPDNELKAGAGAGFSCAFVSKLLTVLGIVCS
jgi:hypothetical protein